MTLGLALGSGCLLIGLHHLGLLVTRRAPAAPAAACAVMGLGMAAMFVPAADPVPHPVWVAVFVGSGAWFAATAWRAGTVLGAAGQHVVGSVAMLFMLLVDPEHAHPAADAGGAPALLVTVLALLLAGWFVADVVRTLLDRSADLRSDASGGTASGGTVTRVGSRVTTTVAAHLAMSVAMAVMLLGTA